MSNKILLSSKNIEQNSIKTVNKKFKIFSPMHHPKLSINKISIDCNALKDNTNNDSHKNTKDISNKKKAFSIDRKYKANSHQFINKFNPHNKIVINCLDENKKKELQLKEKEHLMKLKMLQNNWGIKSNDASPVINFHRNENYFNNQYKRNELHSNSLKVNQEKGFIKEIKNYLNNNKNQYIFNSNKNDSKPIILNSNQKNHKISFTSLAFKNENQLNLIDFDKSDNENSSEEQNNNNDKNEEKIEDDEHKSSDNSSEVGNEEDDQKLVVKSNFEANDNNILKKLNEKEEKTDENNHEVIEENKNLNDNKNESNKNEEILNIVKIKYNNNEKKDLIKTRKKGYRYSLQPNQLSLLNKKIILSSAITKPGICDEEEKINQDSYLIKENLFNEDFNLYGIFDGHGNNGHLVSQYASQYINTYFSNKLNYLDNKDNENDSILNNKVNKIFEENNETIIKQCQNNLDLDINSVNFDIFRSGTTAVLLFLTNELLICSNIGDSQCYLFNCSNDDMWTFESLSKTHKPTDEDEKKRILENGGEIHPYYEEDGIFEGPDRIYAKGKTYPGLSLSRSIGDLDGKKIGIISDPEIVTKKINENSKFIVIGSDGLWDVIQPYDVSRIARTYFNKGDIDGACKNLLKKAELIWKKRNEERDDITIIVIFIGKPNIQLQKESNNLLNEIKENENEENGKNESTKQTPFLLKLD